MKKNAVNRTLNSFGSYAIESNGLTVVKGQGGGDDTKTTGNSGGPSSTTLPPKG